MAGSRGRRASGRLINVSPVQIRLNGEEETWAISVRMDDGRFLPEEGHLLRGVDCAVETAIRLGRVMMMSLHPDCHKFRTVKRKYDKSLFAEMLVLPDEDCSCAHPGRG